MFTSAKREKRTRRGKRAKGPQGVSGAIPRGLLARRTKHGEAYRALRREDTYELLSNPWLLKAAKEIAEYFKQKRTRFDVPLDIPGTAFQHNVWHTLLCTRKGSCLSYSELAKRVGCPQGARAVGNAVGKNPVPIIVPCHRVIRKGGELGGFSSPLAIKKFLLEFERSR